MVDIPAPNVMRDFDNQYLESSRDMHTYFGSANEALNNGEYILIAQRLGTLSERLLATEAIRPEVASVIKNNMRTLRHRARALLATPPPFENAFIPPSRSRSRPTPLHAIVALSKEVDNQAAIRGRRWEPL